MTKPTSWSIKLAAICAVSLSAYASAFDPADYAVRADFEMDIQKSDFLPLGFTRIEGRSALVRGWRGNGTDVLEVLVFTKPLTASDVRTLLANEEAKRPTEFYAQIALFLNKDMNVHKIKLMQNTSNASVASAIASTVNEASKCFSEATFRNGRLTLRGRGSFAEKDPNRDAITMTWNVDLDLPIKQEQAL